eukprot:jgi/Botrbrau1/7512/Bobra.0019s0003.1
MSATKPADDVKANVEVRPKPRRTVDSTSVASSDFEEVRLEDIETASEEVDWTPSSEEEMNSKRSSPEKKGVVGKNSTAPVPSTEGLADAQPEKSAEISRSPLSKSQPSSEISSAEILPSEAGGLVPNAVNAFGEPIYDPLKELETTAAKAAEMAQEAAKQVSAKFIGSANEAVNEAKMSLSKLAGDVSSWWAALDPTRGAEANTSTSEPSTSKANLDATSEVQSLFGLSDTEELMDSFGCSIVQSFTCAHNSFTPTREVEIPGKLYITDKHLCFKATAEDLNFTLQLKDVKKSIEGHCESGWGQQSRGRRIFDG